MINSLKKICFFAVATSFLFTSTYTDYHSTSIGIQKKLGEEALEASLQEKDIVTDISKYENKQLYVTYTDKESKVFTYDTEEDLYYGILNLADEADVESIQPNYTYVSTGSQISDEYYSEQWAFLNDGSFSVVSNEQAVSNYNPFESFWHKSGFFFGRMSSGDSVTNINIFNFSNYSMMSMTSTAVAGIDINMEDAWKSYNGGVRETVVAIIDTGVDYTHEDLKDSIWVNKNEVANDGIDNDNNGYIDDVHGWNFYDDSDIVYVGSEDNHGTHGAGTIVASHNFLGIAGIAGDSSVKIMILKALGGSDGAGSTDSIIRAIQYAESNGAAICNLSFGTSTDDTALKKAIASSNMLFIAAAGNGNSETGIGEDTDQKPTYPAAYDLDNIISVANLSFTGDLHSSSNYGIKTVDLAAPGTYILSSSTNDEYTYMTGTSMSVPMVTGVAAMVYSNYKNVTLAQVKAMILNSVTPLEPLKNKVKTGGMLNAYKALTYDYTELNQSFTSDETTTGEAPIITTQLKVKDNQDYIVVKVTDADDDIKAVAYGKGTIKAKAFKKGNAYTGITLNGNQKKWIKLTKNQTFTFYAIDQAGNETVLTVKTGVPLTKK